MPHFLRPFVLLLTLLLVAVSRPARAQPPRVPLPPPPAQPETDPTDLGGITLAPQNSPFVSHLDAARRAIKDEDWAVATTLLQKVLDLPEDALVQLTRKGPDGKETKGLVSLRAAADRLLGEFPVAGRAFYQQEYGPKAAELLNQARLFGEPIILAEVMRRYLHTEAGAEATERLATHHLDRGRSVLAAVCFERLVQRSGSEGLSALTLFKAILAFRRVGDRDRAEQLWKVLERKVGKDDIELRNRRFKLDELRKELDRLGKPSSPAIRGEWPMFRGDAARSARAAGSNPFPKPVWSEQTARDPTPRAHVERASEALRSQKRPVLVPFHPIAVALRKDTGELPLVVYRSYWGVHARVLKKAGEFEAGELYWEAPSSWSLDRMLQNNQHVGAVMKWLKEYVENGAWPSVLFENTTVGSLSTDGTRVYAVEDFTVPPTTPLGGGKFGPEQRLKDAVHHNRLQAYELETGKLLWEIGAKAEGKKPQGLEDTFFLVPPLPLERKLYVLAEKKEGLCLLTLAPATGNVLASWLLGKVHDGIAENPRRRIHAAPLAHAEGILVCPTNAGAVLGFDLAANRLLWAHAYRDKGDSYTALSDPRFGPPPQGYIYLADGRLVPANLRVAAWAAAGPIIDSGRVIFTAPDSVWLRCLSLRDGRMLWKYQRQDGDLYVGGALEGKVLVVGSKTCRALDLDDGKQVWSLATGVPSGMGAIAGDYYYLPLREDVRTKAPGLCVIDIAKGKIVARISSRTRDVAGNLVFTREHLVAQTPTDIAAYPQLEPELKRIDRLLAKNPDDPEGRAHRADLVLEKGDLAGAIEDLHVALKQEDKLGARLAQRARDRLFEVLTEYLQRDFNAAEKHLKEYEKLCRAEARPGASEDEDRRAKAERARRMAGYYLLLGRGRESQRKFVEAARAYLAFAELGEGGLVPVPDDPALRVSPAVFARGRLVALLKVAPADQRKKIEEEIERRFKKLKSEK